ncbi:hypothetical protein ACNKHP_15740 [Shigella boydii]
MQDVVAELKTRIQEMKIKADI